MATPQDTVIQTISTWLSSNHAKIEKFWEAIEGTDWSMWVRYELFLALDSAMKDASVVYGTPLFEKAKMDLDVFVEPRAAGSQAIVVKLRCERVYGNAGNFEDWAEDMDNDMAQIKKLGVPESDCEGAKLLLVGFSELPGEEGDGYFKTPGKVHRFEAGSVAGWVMEYDLLAEK